jgi:hypothetical protein
MLREYDRNALFTLMRDPPRCADTAHHALRLRASGPLSNDLTQTGGSPRARAARLAILHCARSALLTALRLRSVKQMELA